MPYIKPEWRKVLETDLNFLSEKIKETAKLYGKYPLQRLPIYGYACKELALKVMPEKRYAVLSATRATFFDAADEWCRRIGVEIDKSDFFIDWMFPLLVLLSIDKNQKISIDEEIEALVVLTKGLAKESGNYNMAYPGLLNYCYVALGLKIMDDKNNKLSAKEIAGILEYLGFYFYKNQIASYEDEQIIKNGDVF